jgi:hypothetical protein
MISPERLRPGILFAHVDDSTAVYVIVDMVHMRTSEDTWVDGIAYRPWMNSRQRMFVRDEVSFCARFTEVDG